MEKQILGFGALTPLFGAIGARAPGLGAGMTGLWK